MSVRHGATEARRYATLVGVRGDDILLDIGANYGEVSRLWAGSGATAVAIEPNEELLPVLAAIPGTIVIRGAVVGDDRQEVTFRHTGSSICAYIDDPLVGKPPAAVRYTYSVPAHNFTALVNRHLPTVVKVDAEGSEYLFADRFAVLPAFVRALLVEWHGFAEGHCELANGYDHRLVATGWQRVGGGSLRRHFATSVRGYVR